MYCHQALLDGGGEDDVETLIRGGHFALAEDDNVRSGAAERGKPTYPDPFYLSYLVRFCPVGNCKEEKAIQVYHRFKATKTINNSVVPCLRRRFPAG